MVKTGFFHVHRLGDGAVHVEIDRPQQRNAMTLAMWAELRSLLDGFADAEERVLVLSGSPTSFVSGSDTAEMAQRTWHDAFRAQAQRTVTTLRNAPFVSIAAVRGWALGGGCELATACDITMVTEQSTLGHPEITYGFIPGAGATRILTERVGAARALELVMTGRRISGSESVRIGLATELHSDNEILDAATGLASSIAAADPTAASMAIAVLRAASGRQSAGLLAERLAQTAVFSISRTARPSVEPQSR